MVVKRWIKAEKPVSYIVDTKVQSFTLVLNFGI